MVNKKTALYSELTVGKCASKKILLSRSEDWRSAARNCAPRILRHRIERGMYGKTAIVKKIVAIRSATYRLTISMKYALARDVRRLDWIRREWRSRRYCSVSIAFMVRIAASTCCGARSCVECSSACRDDTFPE
jgi:hypothetical protein